MSKSIMSLLVVGVALLAILLVGCSDEPSPTPSVRTVPSPTSTTEPTAAPEPTNTPTLTPTATPTVTPTDIPTPEPTAPASGGSASPRLTLEEFGAWCSKFEEMAFPETYGEAVKFMEMVYTEGDSLNPPEVLEEYWQTYLEGLKIVRTVLSQYPEDDSVDFTVLFADSNYQATVSAQEAIEDGLPSEARLHVSGCF